MNTFISLAVFIVLNVIVDTFLVFKFKALRNEAKRIIKNAEAIMPKYPFLKHYVDCDEFILITKNKNSQEWTISASCSTEAMETYCPRVRQYFEETDGAIEEINKIIGNPNIKNI